MKITIHNSGSAGNLYQIGSLLIDPGVTLRTIKHALDFKLSTIDGCLILHAHGDHSAGARDLIKAGIDCYCSEYTAGALELSGHRVYIIEPGKQFEIGKYKIMPFDLVHDVPNLGVLISDGRDKCLVAVDTNYVPHRFGAGLTHIILGINYSMEILRENVEEGLINVDLAKRIVTNHMSLRTAKSFFRANDMSAVREIHIVHLSKFNSDPEVFKSEIERVTGRPVYV